MPSKGESNRLMMLLVLGATGFAPSVQFVAPPLPNAVKAAALLVTELSTVGFDRPHMQSQLQDFERSLSRPLHTIRSRTVDRVAAHICMTSVTTSDDLRTFLTERAGVHVSYVDKVMDLCENEVARRPATSLTPDRHLPHP